MGLRIEPFPALHAAGLPRPEDVFLSWLLAQPAGTDLVSAADAEIERLRRYGGIHPGPRKLADLFEALRRSAVGRSDAGTGR